MAGCEHWVRELTAAERLAVLRTDLAVTEAVCQQGRWRGCAMPSWAARRRELAAEIERLEGRASDAG